jgi:hypothetical protein
MAAIFLQALAHRDAFPQAFATIVNASLVDDMADSRPTKQQIGELDDQLVNFFPLCAMEIGKIAAIHMTS